MTTRWRCSPRWNTSPAAWPTLSASSGVIRPLARPRIPSVPKYLRLIFPPAVSKGSQATRRESSNAPSIIACRGYNAFGIEMASKNMMNHYRRAGWRQANSLLIQALPSVPRPRYGTALILALDVMVAFRRRRLGNIDRVRTRKGLLQPLLQGLIEPALLVALGVFA